MRSLRSRPRACSTVWWLTLRAAHHGYVNMNDDIEAAAKQHPELTVVDWNVYSRSHPDWFQDDGLHLLHSGADAMATLIHQTLLDDQVALKAVADHDERTAGCAPWQAVHGHAPRHVRARAVPLVVAWSVHRKGFISRPTEGSSASRLRSPACTCSMCA